MDIVTSIAQLLAGLGAFLLGFKVLSDNIEKLANRGLKKLFSKTQNNRFIGVGIGALVTAIIQSSSAATVMVVGFVNAGILTLFQATAMIMGANIGTTITAYLGALGDLPIMEMLCMLSCIGIFGSMFSKKELTKTIFMALAGLGIVFIGLEFMSGAMEQFKDAPWFTDALKMIKNPFLLMLVGVAFTALVQSSSAVTVIVITMVGMGITIGNGGNSALFLVLGSNIGTCITALISSLGASPNAKRASLIHLMFNLFGSIIFFVILILLPGFMDFMDTYIVPGQPSLQIALFHTLFNVSCTLLFLPFINVFVKISQIVIRDNKSEYVTSNLEERLLKTPSIAILQVSRETVRLGELAMKSLNESIEFFLNKDIDSTPKIKENLENISNMNTSILNYLLKITDQSLTQDDERFVSAIHRILIDLSREAELADNMVKYTRHRVDEGLEFSDAVTEGVTKMKDKLNEQFTIIAAMFEKITKKNLKKSDAVEEEIDILRDELIDGHIQRLEEGKCSPASNSIFISLVSNLERAGDHLNYVAHTLYEVK